MDEIVMEAITKIQDLENRVPDGKSIATGDIRKLSAQLFRLIRNKSLGNVFSICEELLSQRRWDLKVIAFDFAYRVKSYYNESTYDVFYRWLKEYVRDWGDCDDFCTHAFGELLRQRQSLFKKIITWTGDNDFGVRRASAVIMIPSILKNDYHGMNPLIIADHLLLDKNELVLKGYGWMLKIMSQVDRDSVEEYLVKNHERMPRVAFRYALEKFDKKTRSRLMQM